MTTILIADDYINGNSDLSDGTPNDSVISQAFLNHGIPVIAANYGNDPFEPNNGYREAFPIVFGQEYQSYISKRGDFDYYKLTLTLRERTGRLKVNLELPYRWSNNQYYAYDLYLFNEDKDLLATKLIDRVYTYPSDTNNFFISESSSSIIIEPSLNEIYYILIKGTEGQLTEGGNYYHTFNPTGLYKLQCTLEEETLANVRIYPNPYKPNDNKSSTGTDQSGIIFHRITKNANLKIYDLKGRLIFQKDDLGNDFYWEWDVEDNDRRNIPSGIYIYILTNPSGESAKGKFAIIR